MPELPRKGSHESKKNTPGTAGTCCAGCFC
nr:MAG TPA: hypothetical protein [Caudoviricetes sp.]